MLMQFRRRQAPSNDSTVSGDDDDFRQPSPTWLEDRAEELKAGIVFCTRLPLCGNADRRQRYRQSGLGVSARGPCGRPHRRRVYALAHRLGLPAWPAAALTVAATLLVDRLPA